MQAKTVRVSEKGQLAIPVEIRRAMRLRKGSEILILFDGEKMLLARADRAADALLREFDDLLQASSLTARELWGNEADEVWNDL